MITSRQNQKVKDVVKLHSKKHRYIRGAFLVEGKKLYDEALKAGFELEELYSLHPLEGAQVVSESVLSAMATTVTPQDIIAIFKKKIKTTDNIDKCIILDNIQDPGNMGSIIRSALGAGFYTIIAVNCVDKYDPKVIRSSMGAVLHTNVIECDFKECMELVEQANLKMAICSMEGQSIFEAVIPKNIAFVLGNEGNGVSKQFREKSSLIYKIPMSQQLESLNVAVSAGILMYFYLFKIGG